MPAKVHHQSSHARAGRPREGEESPADGKTSMQVIEWRLAKIPVPTKTVPEERAMRWN